MEENFLTFLATHPTLVPGILKSAQIYKNHPNYEDYQQEVLLILLQAYQKEESEEAFEKVAFTLGKCRLIDLLRKETRKSQHLTPLPEDFDISFEEEDAFTTKEFYLLLTPFEKEICLTLQREPNKKALANKLRIPRCQLYRHLKKIQEKAEKFYEL